jgi:hypothetical protein
MEMKTIARKTVDVFRLTTDVLCEGTGCCGTTNPQFSSPQTIHYTNDNFRVLKRMHFNVCECVQVRS